jgi:acyl carrier protein
MAPKLQGAWNLHTQTADAPLDFFVLFSSAAALLGSPGQGNYSAANAFLDALAHHRRGQGQPALSINWGPWSEVGLAAAQANRGERLSFRGFEGITVERGVQALGYALGEGFVQVGVMPLNLRQWRQFYPRAAESPLLAELPWEQEGAGAGPQESRLRETLLAVEAGWRRRALLERHLQEQIAQVLRLDAARIDLQAPLANFGFDSLMALELRNRLEISLGLTLSATLVWSHPTIQAMTPYLAEKMQVPLEAAEQPAPADAPPGVEPARGAAELDDLSADEMAALLAQELVTIRQES